MSKSENKPSEGNSSEQNPMRRVIGNFWYLLKGRGVAGVMLFGATALMARGLGPAEFGMVVLMTSYSGLVRGLINVKQFQGIVRYGVPLQDDGDLPMLRRLINISKRIDFITCGLATVVAFFLAPLIGPLMSLDEQHVTILTWYTLVLLSSGTNTSRGLLRLYDRFDVLGRQMTIGPAIKFIGVAFAWWYDSPVYVYMLVLALAKVTSNIYLIWCGRREYNDSVGQVSPSDSFSSPAMSEFPGLRHFLWVTYWQSNIDLVPRRVSMMMTGSLLGVTEAGLLRLARQIASMLRKPATLIRQVVFPDLTRSWHQRSDGDFKMIAYRTAMIGGAFGLLFVLVGYFFGDGILGLLFGKEFVAASGVLTLLLLAATFDLIASSLRAAAYAIGDAGKVLRIHFVSSVIFLILFVVLTMEMGLLGVAVATCIASLIPAIAMANLIRKSDCSKLA